MEVARKASTEARTSIYRLTGISAFDEALQEKYRKMPTLEFTNVTVGDRPALLITGLTPEKSVGWAPVLEGLSNVEINLTNTTAAAVLVIAASSSANLPATIKRAHQVRFTDVENGLANPAESDGTDGEVPSEDVWALTYGMGFQLLDQGKIDNGFGQRVAIRSADPKDLNSITRVTLDERSKVERSSIPAGAHLRGFGIGDLGELVTRLVASARVEGLSTGSRPIKIRGADALSVPLSKSPELLIADLDAIGDLLDKPPASEELGLLEQLVLVKDKSLGADLDRLLLEAVRVEDSPLLALSWPHERIDENGTPVAFKITGVGRSGVRDNLPVLNDLIVPIRSFEEDEQREQLDRLGVILFKDAAGDEPLSPRIPVRKWLSFQTDLEGRRFCLHDGRWYAMDKPYADQVRERTTSIFDQGPGVQNLPDWPAGASEADYNELVARELNGLCLDRNLIRSSFHKFGIEPCDVLLSDGTYVHVKSIESSAPASHLLAQALVSVEVLTFDRLAQDDFRAKVKAGGWDPFGFPRKPKRVVLLIARKDKAIGPDSLFTFTQVNLARQVSYLGAQGVDVFVAPVARLS